MCHTPNKLYLIFIHLQYHIRVNKIINLIRPLWKLWISPGERLASPLRRTKITVAYTTYYSRLGNSNLDSENPLDSSINMIIWIICLRLDFETIDSFLSFFLHLSLFIHVYFLLTNTNQYCLVTHLQGQIQQINGSLWSWIIYIICIRYTKDKTTRVWREKKIILNSCMYIYLICAIISSRWDRHYNISSR